MQNLTLVASAIAALYLVYAFIRKTQANAVLAKLQLKNHEKDAEELGRLAQEVKNAKIKYSDARRDYDTFLNSQGGDK